MSSTLSIPGLLVLFSVALAPPAVPRLTIALPQAVLAHSVVAESSPSPPVAQPRWFSRALAAWGQPGSVREGLYDERYITW